MSIQHTVSFELHLVGLQEWPVCRHRYAFGRLVSGHARIRGEGTID